MLTTRGLSAPRPRTCDSSVKRILIKLARSRLEAQQEAPTPRNLTRSPRNTGREVSRILKNAKTLKKARFRAAMATFRMTCCSSNPSVAMACRAESQWVAVPNPVRCSPQISLMWVVSPCCQITSPVIRWTSTSTTQS